MENDIIVMVNGNLYCAIKILNGGCYKIINLSVPMGSKFKNLSYNWPKTYLFCAQYYFLCPVWIYRRELNKILYDFMKARRKVCLRWIYGFHLETVNSNYWSNIHYKHTYSMNFHVMPDSYDQMSMSHIQSFAKDWRARDWRIFLKFSKFSKFKNSLVSFVKIPNFWSKSFSE